MAPPPFEPPHPAEIAHHFPQLEILELVGHGGMGMVYKARQPQLNRLVALKILSPALSGDPAFAGRFAREAQSLAKLNHSHVVTVYDFGQAGEFYYFLMEYVDGENLHTLLQEERPTWEVTRRLMGEICQALQYAHEEGVVHRDIKPSNILIDKKGRIKIADFGLARLAGDAAPRPALTTVVMGTPHYMAPEQVETPAMVDHRADLYALGVILYQMLTGELPLGHFEPPSKTAGVDPRLDPVVLRALAKNPATRYQQANDFKADLEAAALPAPRRPRATEPGASRPGRFLAQFALMAGTALLAVGLYVFWSNHWGKKTPNRPPAVQIDFTGAGEGPLLTRRMITTLQLTKAQVTEVARIVRRSQREFVALERQHTQHNRDKAGHVHITVLPFPDDAQKLLDGMWTDLGGVMSAEQLATARRLDFDRFFPKTGHSTVKIEIWRDARGEEHYVETDDGGVNLSPTIPIGRPVPPRYRSYLPGEE
jgi:tRNA A-37 threonylcarbamoyl transferase component Bud32